MSPFKFLDAYEKEDQDSFFGREKETAQLYNAVFAANLTLLYGASGTGKTSLINCGLANKFYPSDWLPIFIRRENDINLSLTKAIQQNREASRGDLLTPESIQAQVKNLYLDHYRPIYLIFDQFEELFILGTEKEQQAFYHSIAELLRAGLQAKVIFIVREEWIAHLNEFEKVIPTLLDNRLRIERMNDRNVARVIQGLCRQAKAPTINIEAPATTIPKIIEYLRDKHQRVDLTNLQVYLDRLFKNSLEKQEEVQPQTIHFNPALVDSVGKIDNVLGTFLEEQMAVLEEQMSQTGNKQVKGLPLEILFTLVTEDGTKQQLNSKGILASLPSNRQINQEQLDYCLQEFQRLRLLRAFEVEETN